MISHALFAVKNLRCTVDVHSAVCFISDSPDITVPHFVVDGIRFGSVSGGTCYLNRNLSQTVTDTKSISSVYLE